jgi:tetratricopeptide (TPR) repeat protein
LPDFGPSRLGDLPTLVVAVAATAALAGVLYMIPRDPEQAWKDCTDRNSDWDQRIRGCSVIARRTEEPADRRATAYFKRGYAYDSGYRRYAEAAADYTEAIRHNPQLAEAYLRRGLTYARLHQYDKVLPDLDAGLKLLGAANDEWLYQVFRERGLTRARAGDFDGAIADHSEEIRLVPRFADGYLHRAAAYIGKGDNEKALADLTEAIRREAYRSPLYVERGNLYVKLGDSDKALADYDEAIKRQPQVNWTSGAYRGRGEILEKRGDLPGALAAYEQAVKLNPSDGEAKAGADRVSAPRK